MAAIRLHRTRKQPFTAAALREGFVAATAPLLAPVNWNRLCEHRRRFLKSYRSHFWTDSRAQIRPSPIAGYGLFAAEPIRQDEIVEVMGGVVMTEAEFRAFQAEADSNSQPYDALQTCGWEMKSRFSRGATLRWGKS